VIQWLLKLIGIPPRTSAERRRDIMRRLVADAGPESSVMVRAQRALQRHEVREATIARHKADGAAKAAAGKEQRTKCQSDIMTSTQGLERARDRVTARRDREGNPFLEAMRARRRAEG